MVAVRKHEEVALVERKRARPRLALVRCDKLPEATDYVDTGCELSPSCLRCPLPHCKYDVPRTSRRLAHSARDRDIVLLRRRHAVPVEMIAVTYGISRRQVFRILRQQQTTENRKEQRTTENRQPNGSKPC